MRTAKDVLGLRLLMAAALVAVLALLIALPVIALHVDAQSEPYEYNVARVQLSQAIRRLALRTEQGAIDDLVFQHADPQIDLAFFDKEMTSVRLADVESEIVYTFDTDDRPVFARKRGVAITGARKEKFAQALRPLLAKLRNRERGSEYARRHPRPGRIPPVIAEAATIIVEGRAFDVQALLISSKSGTIPQRAARAPVLMLVTDIAECLLPPFREHFKMRDVAIIQRPPSPEQSAIPFLGVDRTPVAYLAWTPRRPGMELMEQTAPSIFMVVAILLTATLLAYRGGARNAVALAASEEKSYRLAFYDQLTDLANRRLLNERLAALLERSTADGMPLALLLIDLDRFKFVNDTYGHQCGDELIQEVARRLAASTGPDDLCARLGGDEFVILLADCDPGAAATLAFEVLSTLKQPVVLAMTTVETTGSIGIAVHAGGDGNAGELIRRADLALYRVKDNGRDSFCFFEPEMDRVLQDRRAFETDLREALRTDRLRVEYQPQFTGSMMTGVAARACWDHPTRGRVPPAAFLRLAEDCGQIEELGFSILPRILVDSRRWPGMRIALDISPVLLRMPTFLPRLRAMIVEFDVDPARFDWEIAERSFDSDDIQSRQALAGLRELGGRLVLDDFGASHSMLHLLQRFQIDRIKIARVFLTGLPDDKVSEPTVRAVVGLGDALGFDVIADGVGSEAQRISLANVGCHSIQGALAGSPMTAQGIDDILATTHEYVSSPDRRKAGRAVHA